MSTTFTDIAIFIFSKDKDIPFDNFFKKMCKCSKDSDDNLLLNKKFQKLCRELYVANRPAHNVKLSINENIISKL